MKKLSNITESIWGDLARRSGGSSVRAEDDIDRLDRDEFYDYLKTRYSKLSHIISKDPSEIHITLGWSYFPKMDYKIDIHWVEEAKIKNLYLNFGKCELYDLCDKIFKTGRDNDGISNKEIISIIDFCLDYISSHKEIQSPLNESIWGDLARRSGGTQVRAEDDVNLLDCEEFCDYLKNRYECDMTKSYSGFSTNKTNKGCFMNIPLFVIPEKTFYDLGSFTYYTDEKCLAFGCSHTYYKMKCRKLLEEKCMTLDNITFDKRGYIKGDITNSLVIEFIDFILDNIKEPMIASIRRK